MTTLSPELWPTCSASSGARFLVSARRASMGTGLETVPIIVTRSAFGKASTSARAMSTFLPSTCTLPSFNTVGSPRSTSSSTNETSGTQRPRADTSLSAPLELNSGEVSTRRRHSTERLRSERQPRHTASTFSTSRVSSSEKMRRCRFSSSAANWPVLVSMSQDVTSTRAALAYASAGAGAARRHVSGFRSSVHLSHRAQEQGAGAGRRSRAHAQAEARRGGKSAERSLDPVEGKMGDPTAERGARARPALRGRTNAARPTDRSSALLI